MKTFFEDDPTEEAIFLAGRRTSPGRYRELSTGRTIDLASEGILPASLDGRVACYIRIAYTWAQWTESGGEERRA